MDDKSIATTFGTQTPPQQPVAGSDSFPDTQQKVLAFAQAQVVRLRHQVQKQNAEIEMLEAQVKLREALLERKDRELEELRGLKPLLGIAVARTLLTSQLGNVHGQLVQSIDEAICRSASDAYREYASSVGAAIQSSIAAARDRFLRAGINTAEQHTSIPGDDPAEIAHRVIINNRSMTQDYR